MLKCEKCRERAATVFITRVVDSQSTQARLCEECAREQALADAWLSGAPVPPDAAEMPLEQLMMELLTSAPDPDSFGPDEDKWSLQKLAAYDKLRSQGEFSADEDLADETDEMDDPFADEASEIESQIENGIEISPEEIQAALDNMEPEEREVMSQMLEALDEVNEHLESIMLHQAQELGLDDEAPNEPESEPHDSETSGSESALADLNALLGGYDFLPASDAPTDDSDSDAAEPAEEELALPEFKSAPTQRCPKCRTTWDRLRQDGRVGCASCYETFAEALAESLDRVQQISQHTGKAPRAAARRQRRLEMLRARRDSRLSQLRERLEAALGADEFEEAAKLRDKIKVIESTIVDPSE